VTKLDDILRDELDPQDPDPTTRGGKSGRGTGDPQGGQSDFRVVAPSPGPGSWARLAGALGFGGIAVATLLAVVAGWAG
jgi:hypothetical protein